MKLSNTISIASLATFVNLNVKQMNSLFVEWAYDNNVDINSYFNEDTSNYLVPFNIAIDFAYSFNFKFRENLLLRIGLKMDYYKDRLKKQRQEKIEAQKRKELEDSMNKKLSHNYMAIVYLEDKYSINLLDLIPLDFIEDCLLENLHLDLHFKIIPVSYDIDEILLVAKKIIKNNNIEDYYDQLMDFVDILKIKGY